MGYGLSSACAGPGPGARAADNAAYSLRRAALGSVLAARQIPCPPGAPLLLHSELQRAIEVLGGASDVWPACGGDALLRRRCRPAAGILVA